MKYILRFLLLFLLFFFTISCQADVRVEPAELTITIIDDFQQKNPPTNITILNENDYTVNVTWYLENPNPIALLRPNRTFIENLSWIHVTPSWRLIRPNATESFSIFLTIPELNDLLNQHWETWITMTPHQDGTSSIFSQEYAVRLYIDTPTSSAQPSIPDSNTIGADLLVLLLIAGVVIMGGILAFYLLLKKK